MVERQCPKEVRQAILVFARAVKMVADLNPSRDPLTEYHFREFLPEMENLLVDQLVTAFSCTDDMEEVLNETGLEYLVAKCDSAAAELFLEG